MNSREKNARSVCGVCFGVLTVMAETVESKTAKKMFSSAQKEIKAMSEFLPQPDDGDDIRAMSNKIDFFHWRVLRNAHIPFPIILTVLLGLIEDAKRTAQKIEERERWNTCISRIFSLQKYYDRKLNKWECYNNATMLLKKWR